MKIYLVLLVLTCQSCFLFGKFKKDQISFTEDGVQKTYTIVVPKGFSRMRAEVDSAGNESHFYWYPGGARLYFVRMVDSSVQYQPINYALNLPKELYNATYFKGIDSTDRYWRESRFKNYKLGYFAAAAGEDWKFDSALNYFTLRSAVR